LVRSASSVGAGRSPDMALAPGAAAQKTELRAIRSAGCRGDFAWAGSHAKESIHLLQSAKDKSNRPE
jgi:hypothetical protein